MNTLDNLKQYLVKEKIDLYIIPTNDYHLSEYVSEYFKARAYISKFTGSAGTLVVTQNEALLWTDGRYFIQAEQELKNTGIKLMRMGETNVPTIEEYINICYKDKVIGFDSRVLDTNYVLKLKKLIPTITIKSIDLINNIWPNRPEMPKSQLYKLNESFIGETYNNKVNNIRLEMKNTSSTYHIISTLEDQAWLYNLRADDVKNTPVFLAFTVISLDKTYLFINKNKINNEIFSYLNTNNIILKDYEEIYSFLNNLNNENILVDLNHINYKLYESITNNNIINKENPSYKLKAIKNEIEINMTKLAHIKDGVAMTKAIYWLKTNIDKLDITEISFSDYLTQKRQEQKNFISTSFNTIAGFKEHGAMMHYSATKESDYKLTNDGSLFLVDSGGHYLEGTTDITRTFALGNISDKMKLHYTTVLKSVIALSRAQFLEGCTGQNLDILARGPIWNLGIDYKCGTGHGVGHILSVHEGPNGFRWKVVPERHDNAVLESGMITTNEPGIYLENEYGIRIENEMLCIDKQTNEWGHFLAFETITVCPIDLDAIDTQMLNKDEKDWLNQYHNYVYNTLKPYLTKDEKDWLKENTRNI